MSYQVVNILITKILRFKTSILRSNLCDYSDAYTVLKGRISVRGNNNAKTRNKKLSFKNNAPFRSCISKMNNTFIDNGEGVDIVMLMHNLLEYNNYYSKMSGSLWNYYWDEINDSGNENNGANNYRINKYKTTTSKFIEYKTKIIGRTPNDNILDAENVVSLKYWVIFGDLSICF